MTFLERRKFLLWLIGLLLSQLGLYRKTGAAIRGRRPRRLYYSLTNIKGEWPDVVCVRAKNVYVPSNNSSSYVEDIDQKILSDMISEGVCRISGEKNVRSAWQKIICYQKGERIAIKPNYNWIDTGFEKITPSPQTLNALIEGLIKGLGIRERDVYLYDISRSIPRNYREQIEHRINFVPGNIDRIGSRVFVKLFGDLSRASSDIIRTSKSVSSKERASLLCYVPKVLAQADHLINVPLLKSHPFVLFSGALKNHFGSVRFSDGSFSPRVFHGDHIEKYIVDINKSKHIKEKTRLVICDAIMGSWGNTDFGKARKWSIFNHDHPLSLVFSRNPVSMDAYLCKMITAEHDMQGLELKACSYVEEAHREGLGKCGDLNILEKDIF